MARVQVLPQSDVVATVDSRALVSEGATPAADPATGCPSKLEAFVVNEDPKISVVPHFLSEAECRHLVGLAAGQWIRSLVGTYTQDNGDDDAGPEIQQRTDRAAAEKPRTARKQTRTSQSCMLRYAQTAVVERIEHRLAAIAGLPVEQLERMVLVRYSPGEYFSEHHDGKFRPKTVFVYLNDLPDDDAGDTYFPHLGFSFVPRAGTAVMWPNTKPDGNEDSRLVHAGRPPRTAVKYGVNCFFNADHVRAVNKPTAQFPLESAAVVDVPALVKQKKGPEDALHTFVLLQEPRIVVVPSFASQDEVEEVLRLVREGAGIGQGGLDCKAAATSSPEGASVLFRVFAPAESSTVTALEQRLARATSFEVENITPFRVIQPSAVAGLCNRGCGQRVASISLVEKDEVFFPHIGLRLVFGRGDLLLCPNAWSETEVAPGKRRVLEDLRTLRVHVGSGEGTLCLDASMHHIPIRAELRQEELRQLQQQEGVQQNPQQPLSEREQQHVQSEGPERTGTAT